MVGVAGQRTSYSFEYGTGESFDLSTPVATGDVHHPRGPQITLCLNKAGRGQMETAAGGIRPLRAHVVVAAQAGAETARASVPLSFSRGRS